VLIKEFKDRLSTVDEQIQRAEEEAALQTRMREEMKRQLDDLSREYEELYMRNMSLENSQRDAIKENNEA
jgi:hypothetical protein